MQVRNRVGLGKYSKFVWILLFVLVLTGFFLGGWYLTDYYLNLKGCPEVVSSFSVDSSCNLNEEEVMVFLERGSDDFNLDRIKFEFQPSNSLWKVDGVKCADVRLNENKYGSYCELIGEEEEERYVFNLEEGVQERVDVFVEGGGLSCRIGGVGVGGEC